MAVEQMNISLSPKMARFIRRKVKTGSYTNISEVVRTAVRRMQEEEAREATLAQSRQTIFSPCYLGSSRSSSREGCGKDWQQSNVVSTRITKDVRGSTDWQPASRRADGSGSPDCGPADEALPGFARRTARPG